MSEVLSQTEIDALLTAVSTGTVETAAPAAAEPSEKKDDWIAYDITSQEKIYQGRLVGLNGIHERFARLMRITLSNYFKKNVTIHVSNTDYLKFGDYVGNIALPSSLNLVVLPKLQGHMLFIVPSKLLYALVDAYYGGVERPFEKAATREGFTTIENNMVKKICTMAAKDLQEAWRLNYPLELHYTRMESNPAFIGAIHSTDLVAVVQFDVEFETLSGPFIVLIQLRALDSIQHYLNINVNSEMDRKIGQWRDHWLREVAQTELDVRVELGQTEKSLHEIQSWKPGDVLPLSQDSAAPVRILIEEIEKLHGLMGAYRGNVAVRLVDKDATKDKGE
jgi:flagellar motor switch protein FliM